MVEGTHIIYVDNATLVYQDGIIVATIPNNAIIMQVCINKK